MQDPVVPDHIPGNVKSDGLNLGTNMHHGATVQPDGSRRRSLTQKGIGVLNRYVGHHFSDWESSCAIRTRDRNCATTHRATRFTRERLRQALSAPASALTPCRVGPPPLS